MPPASREVIDLRTDNYATSVADGIWMLEYYAPYVPDAHVDHKLETSLMHVSPKAGLHPTV